MGVYVRYPDGSMKWDESRADPNDNGGSVIDSQTGSVRKGEDRQSAPTGPGGNGQPGTQANPFTSTTKPASTSGSNPQGGLGNPFNGPTNPLPSTPNNPFQPVGQGASKDNFTFDPANADRAFRAGLQANGFDLLNPNGAASPLLRRGSDFQRLFPLLAAIDPSTYGNANSVQDSQRFFGSLPTSFEGLLRQNPQDLLSQVFSNHDATSPLGQLQLYLQNTPDELANVLGAITGLNASPYASNFFNGYLRNLISAANSNAGLLNSHSGNLLGAVQELLKNTRTFQ